MTMQTANIMDLIELTRHLAVPSLEAVILGEGNTSLKLDDDHFLVKASGFGFEQATEETFIELKFAPILALLEKKRVTEKHLQQAYQEAKVDSLDPRRPSVEAIFHAYLLSQPEVEAVAHTHPIAINAMACSPRWQEAFADRLFPDEAVVCGPETAMVPYLDPGAPLALGIAQAVEQYRYKHGTAPKQLIMQNHGLIACGSAPTDALNITKMAIKAAKIRLQALQCGGFAGLGAHTTDHLLGRPDEKYRQDILNHA